MNTTTLTTSITIPKMDLSLLKDLAKKFGWAINNAPANKPGLEEALDNVKNGNIRAVLTGRIVRKCLILRASPWVNVHNTPTRPVGATVKKTPHRHRRPFHIQHSTFKSVPFAGEA